jgi:hypothetical protein
MRVDDPLMRRRHRGYSALLLTCVGVIACLLLPHGLRRLAAIGYMALPLVLIHSLGMPIQEGRWPGLRQRVFRLLGLITLAASVWWYLTPLSQRSTGVVLLVLWTMFVVWSCERLIRNLSLERTITREVLQGALAGYLLLGLAAGLVFSALETIAPGSFVATREQSASVLRVHGGSSDPNSPVWALDRHPHHHRLRRHSSDDTAEPDDLRGGGHHRHDVSGLGDGFADRPLHRPRCGG